MTPILKNSIKKRKEPWKQMALVSTAIKVEFLSVFTFIDAVTFGCRKLLFLFLLLADAYIQSALL